MLIRVYLVMMMMNDDYKYVCGRAEFGYVDKIGYCMAENYLDTLNN